MSFFVSIAVLGLLIGFFLLVAIFSAVDEPPQRVAATPVPRSDEEPAGDVRDAAGAVGDQSTSA